MEERTARPWIDPDELDVVRAFVEAGVRFIVVGGRAVQFHGITRHAKDLDLLVEPSADNWPRLQEALHPLNAAVPRFEELSPQKRYQARIRFYETVEFLTAIEGVCFGEAWTECIETNFAGLQVRVLSKAHLILSKKHRSRLVDIDDIRLSKGIPRRRPDVCFSTNTPQFYFNGRFEDYWEARRAA